jgi:hypothetical protein
MSYLDKNPGAVKPGMEMGGAIDDCFDGHELTMTKPAAEVADIEAARQRKAGQILRFTHKSPRSINTLRAD